MSDKPTIFISHSTDKLPEVDKCRLLKTALNRELYARGWLPFIDSQVVKPGELWRTKIINSLATANACIILLNAAAKDSVWVKAEALIMSFRKSIDPSFMIIPVEFPDADLDATFMKTYEPFQLNEIQSVKVSFTKDDDVDAFAHKLAFSDELNPATVGPPKGVTWVRNLVDLLGELKHDVLGRAAVKLKLDFEPGFDAPAPSETLCMRLRVAIASLLHHREPMECLDAVSEVMLPLGREKSDSLRPRFLSKWVDNESAEALLHAVRVPEKKGLLSLNTSHDDVARLYLDRFTSELPDDTPIHWAFVVAKPDGDFPEKDLIQKVEDAIRAEMLPDPLYDDNGNELSLKDAISALLEPTQQFALAVLPKQFSRTGVLKELRDRYKRIIFIALTGEKGEQRAECEAAAARPLKPDLTFQKLNQRTFLSTNWNALFKKHFPPPPKKST